MDDSTEAGAHRRRLRPTHRIRAGAGRLDTMSESTGITVSATAVVAAPVDRIVIDLGIETLRPDAGEAFRATATAVERVLSILADNGVDSRSVRTRDLSFGPRTTWQADREVLLGYAASQQLLATLTDLGAVEKILSEVAAHGGAGVRINNVELTAAHPDEALQGAREQAVAQALSKAEHFAALTARVLGPLQWLTEGPARGGPAPMAAAFSLSRSEKDASMPVATGDRDISVTITACWAFAG